MFISPIKAIESGWIQGDINSDNIQPNGIDFTLDKLFKVKKDSPSFVLTNDHKTHREWVPCDTFTTINDNHSRKYYSLAQRTSYDFQSNMRVNIPNNICAVIIGRSTLNRNSIFLTSGWWDSGHQGFIGGQIHNLSGPAMLEQGCRIGQIIFAEAGAASMYNGSYNNWSR